jgi:hypothetical protein
VQFVSTRPLQDGRLLALVRPFKGADFGGNMLVIDDNGYVENNQAVPDVTYPTTASAETAATQNDVRTQTANGAPAPSPGGRFNSAFPLWDGTNRVLVSWGQCRLMNKTGQLVACTSANLADAASATPTLTLAPPLYGAWLLNFNDSTLKPVFQPVEGVMVTDVVSLQAKTLPCVTANTCPVDTPPPLASVFDANFGILDIRSVYDRDGAAVGLGVNADLSAVAKASAANRPARFLRIEKAVVFGDPDLMDGFPKFDRAISLSGSVGYMRQILGYVPIEPDGSVRVMVPANVAFQITVVDANARALASFPRHRAWLSVQPGETLSCNGCHTPQPAQVVASPSGVGATIEVSGRSHGRDGLFTALNAGDGTTFTANGNGTVATLTVCPAATMAEELVGATSCNSATTAKYAAAPIGGDVVFNDAWGDGKTNPSGPNGPISYTYAALTTNLPIVQTCGIAWTGFCLSIINYPTVIDPLWAVSRSTVALPNGGATCTNCHTSTRTQNVGGVAVPQPPDGNLQLDADPAQSATAQLRAYTQLVNSHDTLVLNTTNQLVDSGTAVPGTLAAGSANGSCFFQVMTGAKMGCSVTGTVNHVGFMTAAELRLLSEWVDIGAQYYNNPFDAPLAN